jgi:hypothetical protein
LILRLMERRSAGVRVIVGVGLTGLFRVPGRIVAIPSRRRPCRHRSPLPPLTVPRRHRYHGRGRREFPAFQAFTRRSSSPARSCHVRRCSAAVRAATSADALLPQTPPRTGAAIHVQRRSRVGRRSGSRAAAAGVRASWEAAAIGVNLELGRKKEKERMTGLCPTGSGLGGASMGAKRWSTFFFLHRENLTVAVNCGLAVVNRTQTSAREDEESNV